MSVKLDFVGVGAPKCGTTWVADILSSHPDIDFSKYKEANYFTSSQYKKHVRSNYKLIHPTTSDRELASLFKHNGKTKGEFSVYYLYDQQAHHSIKKHNPEMKLVVCLRNPVSASHSWYQYCKNSLNTGLVRSTFLEDFKHNKFYEEMYSYSQHLRNLYDKFDRSQVHVILNEDIANDASRVIKDLYNFIGVSSDYKPPAASKKIYSTRKLRTPWIAPIVQPLFMLAVKLNMRGLLEAIHPITETIFKKPMNQKGRLSQEERHHIYSFFKKDIEETEKLLGMNLDAWRIET